MWRLSIEDDEANRTVVNLVRKEYSIGRAEENSVRLTERNVSRLHAVLRRTSDGWVIEDLKSDTGSFVNERRVESLQPIDHRDKIRIGDYDISLLDSEREADEASIDRQTETVPSAAEGDEQLDRHDRLVVVEGPSPGTQYPLVDKKILLGRGEECDIALQDTSVSRVHASLSRDEHGRFHISDQKSSNGVRVNGMEITKIPLYAGDVVELGDVHLQFVPKGSRFDENALRATVHANAVNSESAGPSKLWWAFGALALVGVVMWLAPERGREPADETAAITPIVSEAAIVEQAEALAAALDFDGAVALVRALPANSPAKASIQYRSIVNGWADAQFQRVESVSDHLTQLQLLQSVADFIDVDPTRRARAQAQIDTLNRPPEPETSDSAGADNTASGNTGVASGSIGPAGSSTGNSSLIATGIPLQPQVNTGVSPPTYVTPVPVKPVAPAAVAAPTGAAVKPTTPAVVVQVPPAPAQITTAGAPIPSAPKPVLAAPAPSPQAPLVVAKPAPVHVPAPVAPSTSTNANSVAPTFPPAVAPPQPQPTAVPQAPKPATPPSQPAGPPQPAPTSAPPKPAPSAQPAPPVVNWPGATP